MISMENSLIAGGVNVIVKRQASLKEGGRSHAQPPTGPVPLTTPPSWRGQRALIPNAQSCIVVLKRLPYVLLFRLLSDSNLRQRG